MFKSNPHHNQIRWACRRGMLELDYFLLSFVDDCFDGLSQEMQGCFVDLLTQADQDLYNWLFNVTPAPAEFVFIIQQIKDHAAHISLLQK